MKPSNAFALKNLLAAEHQLSALRSAMLRHGLTDTDDLDPRLQRHLARLITRVDIRRSEVEAARRASKLDVNFRAR